MSQSTENGIHEINVYAKGKDLILESKENSSSSMGSYALIKGIDRIPEWPQSSDFPFTNPCKLIRILGN